MLNAIIAQCDMIGCHNISSEASTKFKSMQHGGYGRTTMIDLTNKVRL